MVLDSRKVTQGDLFVAVKGHRFDASLFVPQAIASGASAVVLETDLENEHLNIKWQNNVPVIHFYHYQLIFQHWQVNFMIILPKN